jgi:ribonucleotide reductase alpha subunit
MSESVSNYTSEILSSEFLTKYTTKQPPWGFNGLGYIVYKRTYARLLSNGETEEWWQTLARCINGAQKIGAKYTREEAERLYDLMFGFKCSYPGRMLWQLGTSTVDRFGGASLLNCWLVTMNEPKAFEFLFENLMLGGGVGFSVKREHINELPKIKTGVNITHLNTKDADLIVPDSRQGWVKLLHYVLKSFFTNGKSFSYSTILIRGAGEPIKGFGGTASGPQILIDGIEKICKVCKLREGKKLRSLDVLDICNIIGSVVVAGNIRRSALISLGDPDDYLFIKAKRWDLGNIPNWRAMSNNTIYADDFSQISNDIWEGYSGNGEPYGFFNLPLSQKYGRIGELKKDNCEGLNPCVRGDTLILTKQGDIPIKDLEGKRVEVWNGKQWSETVIRKTGENQKLIHIWLEKEELDYDETKDLWVTKYHSFYLNNGLKIQAKDLKAGDILTTTNLPSGESKTFRVVEITGETLTEDVFCCNEPLEHKVVFNGIITGQCGEITLANYECCNLSELFLNNISTKEELFEASRLLYKTQKAVSALPFLYEETNEIVRKNMRLGQSITGVCQSLEKIEWLNEAYLKLKEFDKEWSKQQGFPESIKLSTTKPSGTVSLLAGATPGVHPAFSKYYIRRIRMMSSDRIVEYCKKSGYKVEFALNFDGSQNHDTVVVEFPCKCDNAILAKDMSAINQLELVKKIQTVWADNAVSVTVYYKKEELEDIKKWLKANYKNHIKSVSFLLHSEHGFKQAPYSEITEEEYLNLVKKIKTPTNMSIGTGDIESMECAGGACPIR